MLKPGATFSHFRIEQVLGEGGMGVVYKAFDTNLDRIVALKLISEKLCESEDYRVRLADEAKKAAKVDSPYVVKVWETAECDALPYISFEFVDGEILRSSHGGDDINQKVDIALQIAEGIQAAHKVDLIHRDLKPDNIKLTARGQVKIFDFGLAKTVRPDTVDDQGNIEGTLHYLSPEQLSGESLTYTSDLFSLGTVLFEYFTGERPFEGDYSASIIYSILHEEPPVPSEINHNLPEWIDSLILKLLAKNPADRFENIQAVIEHIDTYQRGDIAPPKAAKPRQTVTVIDIKNLSGDDSWDYFCLGFTEDVINEISRRTDLVVSAEPSTKASRNIREIFKSCRSDFVIVGSLMKWQDNIKLNLSIYGDDGNRLLVGENYEGPVQDLFKLLSDAARDASMSLAKVTGFSSIDVEDYLKTDVSAYEYYLKGKSYYHTSKAEDLEFAISMFKKALEIDPGFALAYSGLADVYAFQYNAWYVHTQERIDAAKEYASKAIEIDSKLPEAHRSLGRCYMFMGDSLLAEKAFLKAVEINPKYAIGYRTLAWLKEMDGDSDQAIYWAKKSLELAPTDLETLLLLSLVNMDLRKYTLAMATLQRAIELGPDYGRAYYNLGSVYLKLGVPDLALENFLLAVKFKGDPNCYLEAGFIHLINKEYDKAKALFEESVEKNYLAFVALYFLGYIEKQRGNTEESMKYYTSSIEAGKVQKGKEILNPYIKVYHALALAGMKEKNSSLIILEELSNMPGLNGEILYNIARVYALLGNTDRANEYIQKSLNEHAGPTEKEIRLDPHFEFLNG